MRWLRFPWFLFVATLASASGEPDMTTSGFATAPRSSERLVLRGTPRPRETAVAPQADALAAAPESLDERDPIRTALALFTAFERRDPDGWVGAMAPDYRFDSNDPSFVIAHPDGFTRDDEFAFATHLFRGDGRAMGGGRRPVVTQVRAPLGAVYVEMRSRSATRAIAHIERYAFTLKFDDGSCVMLAGTDNVLELALQNGDWRVIAWHERMRVAPVAASLVVESAGKPDASALPDRLAIRRLGELGGSSIAFELALPARGGTLELFDLQGRRMARRGLDGVAPGIRRIELSASGVPAGTYWARLQQAGAVATTRVIRVY